MKLRKYTPAVAAILLFLCFFPPVLPAMAQADEEQALLEQLQHPVDGDWQEVEKRLRELWSDSGSDAMNLLLERGRKAIRDGKPKIAIEHLTALTDHAPDFAEGWNARAAAWFMLGNLGPAASDIAHALALNPHHFGAMMGMGKIFEATDQPKKALEIYRSALSIHPASPDIKKAVKRLEQEVLGKSL